LIHEYERGKLVEW